MDSNDPGIFVKHDIQVPIDVEEQHDAVFEEWAAGTSHQIEKGEHNEVDELEMVEKVDEVPYPRKKGTRKATTFATCEICGVLLKHPSRIREHMRTHTGEKPFECDICGQRFSQRTPMVNHYRVQHFNDLPFICQYGCGKRFVNAARKNAHELRHVGMKRNGPPRPHLKPEKKLILPPNDEIQRNPNLSNAASANFVPAPSISTGFRDQIQNTSPIPQKPLSKDSAQRIDDVISSVLARVLAPQIEEHEVEKAPNVVEKRPYVSRRAATRAQCTICGLMLKHPSKIADHIRTHTGEKPYECGECGLCLSKATSLKVHIRRMHTGERPFPCQWECGMWFVTDSVRKEHELAVHSGTKRYACSVKNCEAVFARKAYLMRHRKNAHGQFFTEVFDPVQVSADEANDPVMPEKSLYLEEQEHLLILSQLEHEMSHFDAEEFVEQQ